MNVTKKEKAIELMENLKICEPYIEDFKKNGKVSFFEYYAGYWIDQEPEIYAKLRELEKEYNCLVYAVTHEFTDFGELYDFLIVTNYPEEWDELIYSRVNKHNVYAYVWNKDDDGCSEFGNITVQSYGGGIKRIA